MGRSGRYETTGLLLTLALAAPVPSDAGYRAPAASVSVAADGRSATEPSSAAALMRHERPPSDVSDFALRRWAVRADTGASFVGHDGDDNDDSSQSEELLRPAAEKRYALVMEQERLLALAGSGERTPGPIDPPPTMPSLNNSNASNGTNTMTSFNTTHDGTTDKYCWLRFDGALHGFTEVGNFNNTRDCHTNCEYDTRCQAYSTDQAYAAPYCSWDLAGKCMCGDELRLERSIGATLWRFDRDCKRHLKWH
jgi:hypothetical protein